MSPLIRSGAVMWHLWKPVTLLLMTTCFSMKSVMSWGTIFSTTFESAGKIDIGRSSTLNAGLSSFAIWGFGFNGWFSKHHAIYGNIVHFPQKTYALNVFRPLMRSGQIYKSATNLLNLLNVLRLEAYPSEFLKLSILGVFIQRAGGLVTRVFLRGQCHSQNSWNS